MEKIKIGKIVNTHGIKGELKVAYEDEQLFEKAMDIYINFGTEFVEYNINTIRKHKNHLLITIGKYSNINQVLQYKGCDIYAIKNNDDVYISDLTSYFVVSDNKDLGRVKQIISNGAQDILVLENGCMIPFVDEFVKEIDEDNSQIKVSLIDGMCNED